MPDCDEWLGSALAYRPTLNEYCQLALRPSLDQAGADRLGEILHRAETEPLLDWLIDQADTLVAQCQFGLDDRHLRRQQQQLREKIDALWVEQVLSACHGHI
jgi:hypothetical protein